MNKEQQTQEPIFKQIEMKKMWKKKGKIQLIFLKTLLNIFFKHRKFGLKVN
jgi:hypothetical protein